MPIHVVLLVLLVGAGVGFLGGLLGKGGAAIATPLLVAVGIPAMIAVAAPLPATLPGTLFAADGYRRKGLLDYQVLRWSLLAGVPATVVGALLTRWVTAGALVLITDIVIAGLGVRMLVHPSPATEVAGEPPARSSILAVAAVSGLVAGLLANSGGFLLAPLFIGVLGLRVKPAFGTSLAVAAVLAVPGTLVHLALGHVRWSVVLVFAAGSVPLSGFGARVALRSDAAKLERFYGVGLVLLGAGFLLSSLR